jgi:hypothetical protein
MHVLKIALALIRFYQAAVLDAANMDLKSKEKPQLYQLPKEQLKSGQKLK